METCDDRNNQNDRSSVSSRLSDNPSAVNVVAFLIHKVHKLDPAFFKYEHILTSVTFVVKSSSQSFIYIKNTIGPNTDPCGTPLQTDFQFEISPSTITLCLLCVSHFFIHYIITYIMGF